MGRILAGYRKLFDGLKRKIHKIYFLYGQEEYLKKEFIGSLVKTALPEKNRAFNLDIFYGDDFDKNAFDDRISSFPLFASRRVIIIKKFDGIPVAGKDFVLAKLENIPESLTVVIESSSAKVDNARMRALNNLAEKQGVSFNFRYLSEQETLERVETRLQKRGFKIEPDALALLVESVGTQLFDLSNEVEKVASIADGQVISSELVKKVVGKYRTESIFSLLDLIDSGNLETMIKALNGLIDGGEEPVFINAMLLRRTLLLLEVKLLQDSGAAAGLVNQHLGGQASPFVISKLIRQARGFELEELELLLENLIWADAKIKSSQIDPRMLLEEALAAFSLRKKLATFSS